MKAFSFFLILPILFLFCISELSAESDAEKRIQDWISKFGGSSAVDAIFKTQSSEAVAKNKELYDFVLSGGRALIDVPDEVSGQIKQVPIEDFSTTDQRDLKIIDNIEKTIGEAGDRDLVIVFVGQVHALDYFFRKTKGPKEGIYYIGLNIDQTKKGYSPEMVRVLELYRDLKKVIQFGSEFDETEMLKDAQIDATGSSSVEPALRLGAVLYEKNSAISEKDRQNYLRGINRNVTIEKPKVIFFSDFHYQRNMDHVLQMVGAEDLKAMGYNRIIFSYEGYNPDQNLINISALLQHDYWTDFNISFEKMFSGLLGMVDARIVSFQAARNPNYAAIAKLENLRARIEKSLIDINSGRVTKTPVLLALLLKLREIEAASKGAIQVLPVGNDMRVGSAINSISSSEPAQAQPLVRWGWPELLLKAQ